METKVYVQCIVCRVKLSEYFATFKKCPLCGEKSLWVEERQGWNLPQFLEIAGTL
jgi:predicted RNA-binding Zn-ribbon protein involved in translation (DUF1610 family)